jgi:DNA-binding IclR family transcriptional regulator
VERSVSGVGVLDKAVVLLGALERGPLPLADLVRVSGLPRATTHRLAVALEDHGLVRRDGDGRFTLGPRLVAFGRAAADAFPLAVAARPALEALRDRTGESVQLYVAEGDGRRCLVSLQSPHALRWIVPEGALLPIDRGSAGKLLRARAQVGPEGWAESVEEREAGVCSVSAPVRDRHGSVLAAVSVSGPVERLSRTPGQRFGAAVVAAASDVALAASAS